MPAAPPAVSVIIPVHNRESIVSEAIGSILRQSMSDLELIVVDDGSTDASARVAASFDDPRLRIARHEANRGIPAARNTGLDLARGSLIAWLDSDDVARPTRLEEQARFLHDNPSVAMVGCCAGKIGDRRGVRVPPLRSAHVEAWLLFRSAFQQSSIMGHGEILRRHPYREEFQVCEDIDMFIRLGRTHRLCNMPRVLVDRRLHRGQTIRLRADAIRERKAALAADLLAEVGMPFSDEDLRRHAMFGKSRFETRVDPDHLPWAEAWLRELRTRNALSGRFDAGGLHFATSWFWMLACVAAGRRTGRGRALAAFLRSPLSGGLASSHARGWARQAAPLFLRGG